MSVGSTTYRKRKLANNGPFARPNPPTPARANAGPSCIKLSSPRNTLPNEDIPSEVGKEEEAPAAQQGQDNATEPKVKTSSISSFRVDVSSPSLPTPARTLIHT
ncbi:hypothetical protein BDV93DRAFT_67235 [Ceratobasidium sp. AG-I]|nr:hypothetical protein BDV93DRAFT_67235 [Ceratobasidium sp. AG-I]